MSLGLEGVLHAGTRASVRQAQGESICLAQPITPVPFPLLGAMTGATACTAPTGLRDWTSANVIELAHPMRVSAHTGVIRIGTYEVESPVQRRLDEIKRKSSLTWAQLADALDVDARAVHLWRRGGGISAGHEERLHHLNALIETVDVGTSADTRAELIETIPGGSLLDRLRRGESPLVLIPTAPWRSRARSSLERNMAARNHDGVVDEDYVFLLYLDDDALRAFADEAAALLDSPESTRGAWESMIDAQLTRMEQPEVVVVQNDDDVQDLAEGGIAPLFRPTDLGISLNVGAIAARRALHEVE